MCISVVSAGDIKSKGASSKKELASLYRQYFEKKDTQNIRSLVYWPGVLDFERNSFNRSVNYDMEFKLQKIEIAPLDKNQMLEYTREGITYKPTLKPLCKLVATYVPHGDLDKLSTSYLVGVRDKRYYIILASPASK